MVTSAFRKDAAQSAKADTAAKTLIWNKMYQSPPPDANRRLQLQRPHQQRHTRDLLPLQKRRQLLRDSHGRAGVPERGGPYLHRRGAGDQELRGVRTRRDPAQSDYRNLHRSEEHTSELQSRQYLV